MNRHPFFILALLIAIPLSATVSGQEFKLKYKPAPADNPLKGLVPYAGQGNDFPHSMQFSYFPMNKLMTGEDSFDWSPVEKVLDQIKTENCQAVIRVFMEYPSRGCAVPQFLIDEGITITQYTHGNDRTYTPDYDDPKTRVTMKKFITAFGNEYDGDPRIGFITMGILGQWGEWHTYPRDDLFASKETQTEVMDAFESSFNKTKILMRYPTGKSTWEKAPNDDRPFGYHDDSFAWATLDTGKRENDWYFVPAMKSAGKGAMEKWKSQPIGGEIRPELWGCVFDSPSCAPKGQEFNKCVLATHCSWLLDSGMFAAANEHPTEQRRAEAIRQVKKMGYELHIESANIKQDAKRVSLEVTVINKGVAPFYYDWPIKVAITDGQTALANTTTNWKLTSVLPGEKTKWRTDIELNAVSETLKVGLRVINPMDNGKPLRFANEGQRVDGLLELN